MSGDRDWRQVIARFLIALTFLCPVTVYAKSSMELIEVEARGVAMNESKALQAALTEAIGRVNGRQIAALQRLDENWVENSTTAAGGDYSSSMQQKVTDLTNGAVDSYDLISSQTLDTGEVVVIVRARIARLKKEKSGRLSLAVQPFAAVSRDASSEQLATTLTRALLADLTSSRRFEVIDRLDTKSLQAERDKTVKNQYVSSSDKMRVSRDLAADLVISGTVESVAFELKEVEFKAIQKSFSVPQGFAQISYQVRNVATGEVRFSDVASLNFTANDFSGYGQGMTKISPAAAIAELASKQIALKILEASYPLVILSQEGDSVTLNQGGDLVQVGALYDVFESGEKIVDPYTKESLGRRERPVGQIEIARVTSKFSVGYWLAEINAPFSQDAIEKGRLICRLNKPAPTPGEKRREDSKARIEKAKKAMDDDW